MLRLPGSKKKVEMRSVVASCFGCLVVLVLSAKSIQASTQSGETEITYLKSLDIERLLQTKVTSVSKKRESLGQAAAAVFVLTAEDLRRTGARNIPEALRMVPGIQVSQIDGSKWAITSRGFSDYFSNKLLVLMDGRSVYTPHFSGVLWDVQDTLIEDIDRIEVIRGPGATLWGANAVNGVINIITKSADKTQGGLVSVGVGTTHLTSTGVRYGGKLKDDSTFRLYAKGDKYDNQVDASGDDAHDEWHKFQSGFRADLATTSTDTLTLQGDLFKGEEDTTYSVGIASTSSGIEDTMEFQGGNFITRWQRSLAEGDYISVKAYYDYTDKETFVAEEIRHTFDMELEHCWSLTNRQHVVWGLGYRISTDDVEDTLYSEFDPSSRTDHLFSGFIQDEVEITQDRWWLTLGSKFEHNDYTGFEVQPNVRLRWQPAPLQTVWASISRAVRTPSRADHDMTVYTSRTSDEDGNLFLSTLSGNEDFESEDLIAYEAGYRWSPTSTLNFDAALFFNDYENLRSIDIGRMTTIQTGDTTQIIAPTYFANSLNGETYGVEILAIWQPLQTWKLSASYSLLQTSLSGADGTTTLWEYQEFEEDDFPQHQAQLRSYLNLPFNLNFDTEIYYMGELESENIDDYVRLDLRLGWQASETVEVSINGENLLDSQRQEFANTNNIVASEVPRQIYAKVTWLF